MFQPNIMVFPAHPNRFICESQVKNLCFESGNIIDSFLTLRSGMKKPSTFPYVMGLANIGTEGLVTYSPSASQR